MDRDAWQGTRKDQLEKKKKKEKEEVSLLSEHFLVPT